MPEKKIDKNAGPSLDTDALLGRIAALESQLELLKYSADDLSRKRDKDPTELWKRAKERVAKSKRPKPGKYTWRVTVPGVVYPVTFQSDTDNEAAAIREFETRFGTRFIENNQREEDNHKIERVAESSAA